MAATARKAEPTGPRTRPRSNPYEQRGARPVRERVRAEGLARRRSQRGTQQQRTAYDGLGGGAEQSGAADGGGVGPVPAQMWEG
jgi:hypothetical protein